MVMVWLLLKYDAQQFQSFVLKLNAIFWTPCDKIADWYIDIDIDWYIDAIFGKLMILIDILILDWYWKLDAIIGTPLDKIAYWYIDIGIDWYIDIGLILETECNILDTSW